MSYVRPTIKKINAAIAPHRVEVVKGKGYYWFHNFMDNEDIVYVPSVYCTRLSDLSLESWIAHVEDCKKVYYA